MSRPSTPICSVLLLSMVLCIASHAAARPNHIVHGYVPVWFDAKADPADYDFNAFTHLSRAFLRPRPDGSLGVEDGYFNPAFEAKAHAAGVKLLMSIGGTSRSPDPWKIFPRDPKAVVTFLGTIEQLYAVHHYDGVDIDAEPPPQTVDDGNAYADLIEKIRHRFAGKLLMMTVSGTHYAVGHLPLERILPNIDFVNGMFYDYSASWTGIASFATNLNRDASPAVHTVTSVNEGLHTLLETYHIPPTKLLVGLNFWGYRFRVDHLGDKFEKNAAGLADDVEYSRVLDLLHTGRYTAGHSDSAGADYLVRGAGGGVITYETPASITVKCKRAIELNCAGVMIWNAGVDTDAGRNPLLSAIAETFGVGPLPLSTASLKHEIARLSQSPVPSNLSTDALLRLDADLRAGRGVADDDAWGASRPKAPAN